MLERPDVGVLPRRAVLDRQEEQPQAALCTCDAVKNLGAYVIVTSKYIPATCTTGVISSAAVPQSTQITNYIKNKSKQLTAFPIQVPNK
ncbi:MAG: hypothetical protein WA184_25310 [Stellaceae bacterium]|jgi:hypothetical protein